MDLSIENFIFLKINGVNRILFGENGALLVWRGLFFRRMSGLMGLNIIDKIFIRYRFLRNVKSIGSMSYCMSKKNKGDLPNPEFTF